ncbi:MAG: hypothetical protein GXO65_05070 [Euryarchaeota archaeon]|nr:hypothetical protein [Euryarchaeota archaeon]
MISEIERKLALLDQELHSILEMVRSKPKYDPNEEVEDTKKLVSAIKKHRVDPEDSTSIIRKMREGSYG